MENNTKWKNEQYLPILSERHCLMLVEILHYGDTNPELLIYQSAKRGKIRANLFQKEVYGGFTEGMYQDIVEFLKPSSNLLTELNEWKKKEIEIDTGKDILSKLYLLLAIRLQCSLSNTDLFNAFSTAITWTETQLWHWRLFFAKLLILA